MPLRPPLPRFEDLLRGVDQLGLRSVTRWLGLGIAVGLASGVVALLFYLGMSWVSHVVLDGWANLHLHEPRGEHAIFAPLASGPVRGWVLVLAPAVGGLISGVLVKRFAPEAEGHGTDALIHAFHEGVPIRKRIPLVKGIASVIVIGTGGSAGREGPIAQISGALGQMLGRVFKLNERERRLFMLAGAAGGIGAIFRTPLGAALFITEVLYRDDTESEAFVPSVISSVIAYSTITVVLGEGAMLAVAGGFDFKPLQLPLYVIMAVACGLMGVLYVKVFYGFAGAFKKLPVPGWLTPAVGGLGVGLIALFITPAGLGAGYGLLQDILDTARTPESVTWVAGATLIGFALLKIVTTSFTVGSGGSGGVFGPSVVIGGLVGGAFGYFFHLWLPDVVPNPDAFVIVGMASFVGGVCHAPVSTLVMACEMTGSYELLVPLMLAEAVTFVILRPVSLYHRQVGSRKDSAAHWADHLFDVLKSLTVEGAFQRVARAHVVNAAMPLNQVLREMSASSQSVMPVVDAAGKPQGLVSLDTLRSFLFEDSLGVIAVAHDCQQELVTLKPDDVLSTALEHFMTSRCRQLPVVSPDDPAHILGFLGYEDLLRAYDQELVRRGIKVGRIPTKPPGVSGQMP